LGEARWRRLGAALLGALSALVSALWIAICAAAPEFIWQGLDATLHHLSRADLAAALLIGLMLAFFVEPLIERVRELLVAGERGRTTQPRSPLFTAGLSLAFAFSSANLHHAMTGFVSGHGGAPGDGGALAAGISLTIAWAFVPFAVTLAWLNARRLALGLPLGIFAAASPGIAGWLFNWSPESVVTTAVPSLCILGLGYRRMRRADGRPAFVAAARIVAFVGAGWLVLAFIVNAVGWLGLFYAVTPYDVPHLWVDLRFYAGWTLGLLFAPSPGTTPQPPNARVRDGMSGA
jgi:hypothetical protein